MEGTMLVLDGLDGCGKTTQSQRLAQRLEEKFPGRVHLISYPDYESPSSALVRMYLNGDFSAHPDGVNAYAASTFYAVDRYAGFAAVGGVVPERPFDFGRPVHHLQRHPPNGKAAPAAVERLSGLAGGL